MNHPDQSSSKHGWTQRACALLPLSLVLFSACQQKMADQPYFRPLEETPFFADGRASRPIETGTVARGTLSDTHPFMTGLTKEGRKAKEMTITSPNSKDVFGVVGAPDTTKNFVDAFPFKMTADDLNRGMERYTIFCTPCHGALGDGKGKIVERGILKPTSYHPDFAFADSRKKDDKTLPPGYSRGFGRYRLEVPMTEVPVGYYFEVINKGYGGMPEHGSQIPDVLDRWRIIAYIRVLQLSQSVKLDDLPKKLRDEAREEAIKTAADASHGGKHP